MKNKLTTIQSYLLRFDFSKKVIFILAFAILTAFILLGTILLTYQNLNHILKTQLVGINLFDRTAAIFYTAANLESQIFKLSKDQRATLEAELGTHDSNFDSIIIEMRKFIKKNPIENETEYLNQISFWEEKIHTQIQSIQQNQWNEENSPDEMRELLTQLKKNIFSFLSLINDIFNLHLFINKTTGLKIDTLINFLPTFQDSLSQFLSINMIDLKPEEWVEIFNEHLLIEDQVDFFLNVYQLLSFKKEIKDPFEKFLNSAVKFTNLLPTKIYQEETLKLAWDDIHAIGLSLLHQSRELFTHLSKNLTDSISRQIHTNFLRQIYSLLLFLLGTCFVLLPYLTQAFRSPLVDLMNAAEKLTDGDLTVRIPIIQANEVGEVSKSFNETAGVFEKIIVKTDNFATILSHYSSEIFSTAKKLEQNLGTQENAVQDITKNSKNILRTVQDFSFHLSQVNSTIQMTAEQVNLSQDSLSALEMIMQRMASSANNTVSALSSIKSEIDKISIVINTLIIIADQINLLSLNTAIRASKTGLKKLGYTVIADKIRDLANQTAYATLDMEQNVHQILSVVPEIVRDIDQFGHEIKGALDDSIVVREQFQQLFTILQNHIASFLTINKDMQDQAQETVDIDKAINMLLVSTQKITNSVKSLYVEIEYLHSSTRNLLEMTKNFTSNSISKAIEESDVLQSQSSEDKRL